MIPSKDDFLKELKLRALNLNPDQLERAALFAHILHRENATQNLTRILGVNEFIEGHLSDVLELFSTKIGNVIVDIGSGSGVPGLLAACIDLNPSRKWHLVESEKSKANYLDLAAVEMGLTNVIVTPRRIIEAINDIKPDTVIARAVGTVDKIASWIWECSTWNNLVLFKSKGWEAEWELSQTTRFGKKLTVTHVHDYSSPDKTRVLITLSKKKFG